MHATTITIVLMSQLAGTEILSPAHRTEVSRGEVGIYGGCHVSGTMTGGYDANSLNSIALMRPDQMDQTDGDLCAVHIGEDEIQVRPEVTGQ